jgi:6-phosphogluconolactonase/glucosamine-6-phosphate isomerase/deaminase
LLARIEEVIVIVTGGEKRGIVERLMSSPRTCAAGLALEEHANAVLWVDRDAAPAGG